MVHASILKANIAISLLVIIDFEIFRFVFMVIDL
jgi:hypothetical protein